MTPERRIHQLIKEMVEAAASGSTTDVLAAELGQVLGALGAAADLGARLGLLGVSVPRIAAVPLNEAVESFTSRHPELANTGPEVAAVYGRNGFALAESANLAVTQAVQDRITQGLRTGEKPGDTKEAISQLGGWVKSYADTVYRTARASAVTAGRFRQMADPAVTDKFPALRYVTMGDERVRRGRPEDSGENHLALHGLVAAPSSRIWKTFAPPNGYRCRCYVRPVHSMTLTKMGIDVPVEDPEVPPDASIHPSFAKVRPDHALYFGIKG